MNLWTGTALEKKNVKLTPKQILTVSDRRERFYGEVFSKQKMQYLSTERILAIPGPDGGDGKKNWPSDDDHGQRWSMRMKLWILK